MSNKKNKVQFWSKSILSSLNSREIQTVSLFHQCFEVHFFLCYRYIIHQRQLQMIVSIEFEFKEVKCLALWVKFSADDNIEICFLFFSENRIWHFMQIVSSGDNLHEMSNPFFFCEKWEKYHQFVVCWIAMRVVNVNIKILPCFCSYIFVYTYTPLI